MPISQVAPESLLLRSGVSDVNFNEKERVRGERRKHARPWRPEMETRREAPAEPDGACFHSLMRWKPEAESCRECAFEWNVSTEDAVSLVGRSPQRIAALFTGADRVRQRPAPEVWSPAAYLWHLVDVLRIGFERLLTTSIDPAAGIPCWDENVLASVRRYEELSPRVGLVAYESAVSAWVSVAKRVAMDASVEHPQLGTVTAEDIIRRNAHEVQHHELDIRRGLTPRGG